MQTSAVVAMNNGSSSNTASIPVGGVFTDGTQLQDALSGRDLLRQRRERAGDAGGAHGSGAVAVAGQRGPGAADRFDHDHASANGNGWINTLPVTVNLSATDSGSGVEQLRYWINNGPVTAVAGSSASTQLTAQGSYNVGLRALDNAGNISALATANFGIDVTPPVVNVSASPSSLWPAEWYRWFGHCLRDDYRQLVGGESQHRGIRRDGRVWKHSTERPGDLGAGGSYSFTVSLQASRNGNDKDGRHYSINVSAKDYAGNLGSGGGNRNRSARPGALRTADRRHSFGMRRPPGAAFRFRRGRPGAPV